jgi:hypothetical protein
MSQWAIYVGPRKNWGLETINTGVDRELQTPWIFMYPRQLNPCLGWAELHQMTFQCVQLYVSVNHRYVNKHIMRASTHGDTSPRRRHKNLGTKRSNPKERKTFLTFLAGAYTVAMDLMNTCSAYRCATVAATGRRLKQTMQRRCANSLTSAKRRASYRLFVATPHSPEHSKMCTVCIETHYTLYKLSEIYALGTGDNDDDDDQISSQFFQGNLSSNSLWLNT